jgi:hypothetical protein
MFKFLKQSVRQYIFIIFTATILLIIPFSKSFSQENIFTVEEVIIKGLIDKNFNRDKYINKALKKSLKMLMSKILVSSDLTKIKNLKAQDIKYLINSFQVLKEDYDRDEYEIKLKIFYNEKKIKEMLRNKRISYSQPNRVKAVIIPALFIAGEIKSFQQNYFYKEWNKNIKNELVEFIMPLEDLEDFSKIKKMKDKINDLNLIQIANKYNEENYIFLFMDYENEVMKIYVKTRLEGNKISKNLLYKIENFNNKKQLNYILSDLKIKIEDIWKEINFVNLLMPLSISVKFNHSSNTNLDNFKKTLYNINIIDNYFFEKFDINSSYFKISYFGTPKRLKSELNKSGYDLKDSQGQWEIVLYE